MPYFVCDTLGTGADAEGNEFRPAVALYSNAWTVTADGLGRMLVRCAHVPAFDSDARIRPMRRSQLANLAPVDGETDDWSAADLATKFARRFLVRQFLGADDFDITAGALARTLSEIPAPRRNRIREKLLARGIDISGLSGATTIADALRTILPNIDVRLDPRAISPSGTFTDDFNGEGAEVDLVSHTPSGGTSWTQVDGLSTEAKVSTSGVLRNNTTNGGCLIRCDDQGSANQYVQAVVKTTSIGAFVCNRGTDGNNFIGWRPFGTAYQFFKRSAGTFTSLATSAGAPSVNETGRLESSGNSHELYVNGVSAAGPVTDATHASVTRQGVCPRSTGAADWLDDFEAGTLGAAPAARVYRFTLLGVS
jgi:hypothetical protein